MKRISRPSPALVVASVALVAATGGVTYAAIPAPDGTIHACHDLRGSLRVIDSDAACAQGETALNFSQTGPQGAKGDPGAPGQSRLLNFTRSAALAVPRKAGTPVGSFDLPEGKWAITFTGGVKIPSSKPVSLNFTRGNKLRAAAVDGYRGVAPGSKVTCKMTVGDGSVRQVVGNSELIGLLLPAVQSQHGTGGGGGAGKGDIYEATIYMNLAHDVPAGGEHGFLACKQGKAQEGFSSPAAQLHDISIHAVQVDAIGGLNFTPAG